MGIVSSVLTLNQYHARPDMTLNDIHPHPYATPEFARSFESGFAVDVVSNSGIGWLRRDIPESGNIDHCGPYPLVSIKDYEKAYRDLDLLRDLGSVSAVFVTDPFCEREASGELSALTLCRPYKTHYIVDTASPWRENLTKHHRQELRYAEREKVTVNIFPADASYGETFWNLYRVLIARHGITGIQALSKTIVEAQCALNGVIIVEASNAEDAVIGSSIWFHDACNAHIHLHAQSPEGYKKRVGYLIYKAALDHFTQRECQVDLGGGAGLADDASDGLARFKRGFANRRAKTLLCGQILQPGLYAELAGARAESSEFFPAYRAPV